jgi:peptidoglycan/xylan/chitin deacetylase (PgdA/CDA1 family)
VALTFDDGPDPVNTPRILDLLRRNEVRATFCVVGTRVRAHPALVRRIVAEGHTLCNHSWQHRLDLGTRTPAEIRADLSRTDDAIHAAVPDAPVRYFRAPGGRFSPALVGGARTLGMTPLFWQVDPRDWDSGSFGTGTPLADHVVAAVRAAVRPGAIVLSHDSGHPDTVTAYAELLPWLKARFALAALPA